VGLLGMPRRNYTYPSGLGWDGYNLLESIGSYILTVGLLIMTVNLVVSLRRGARVGNDPWGGDTLEWAVSSPPPEYNFAVIPTVSSSYAMWDKDDREKDNARLSRGEMTLERGHETPASTVMDAVLDEVLEMPPHSIWPPLVALALSGVFAFLLIGHTLVAVAFAGLLVLTIFGWNNKEPQEL
jgi:cytochrome c oxidase subunit I+III